MLRGKKDRSGITDYHRQSVSIACLWFNIQSNISSFFSGGKWRASQTQTKTGNHKMLVSVSQHHVQ